MAEASGPRSTIGVIRGTDIEAALALAPRQYLMGALQRPQELAHLPHDHLEVGVVDYPTPAADVPHTHPVAGEYQYVLAGRLRLLNLRTRDVHELVAGDFYAVAPDTPHVQKAVAGTRVFFFKVPGGNDKTPVEVDAETALWLEDLDF